MNQFQAAASRLFEHPGQDQDKQERARQAQGWKEHRSSEGADEENATVKAAAAVAEEAGVELTQEQKRAGGNAMHYGFGIASGALYGALAEEWPATRAAGGAAFGVCLWLAADEIAVPALGLSKSPREYPARVHAMALGSHLVYGLTTELMRWALRR